MVKHSKARQHHLSIPMGIPEGFVPTAPSGLTQEEARRRLAAGQGNTAKADPGKSIGQILASNLFTLFNLLNAALAVALAAVHSYQNMLFLGVVISNTVIGAVQELRAHRTIQKLKLLNTAQVHVYRSNQELPVRPEELVLGDLVILRSGDQVPADAIIREGMGAANESLLTGESDAVSKEPGQWLMSGSYINEGRFVVQLCAVGPDSYINRLTAAAKTIKPPKSALMTDLNRIIRFVSIVLLPLGLLLFCKQYFLLHTEIESAVPSTVAAMLGMIPEGLMLLTSMALAVGVVKLGKRNTLVQELYGIETLARADVLCLDKTGTLTTGGMSLHHLHPLDGDEDTMQQSLARFLGAFEEAPGTLAALRQAVTAGTETPRAVIPFSSARKLSAATFGDGRTLILGAPSFVLGDQYRGQVRDAAEKAAEAGFRVMALCEAEGAIQDQQLPPVTRILGLCMLEDTLRPHCAETLHYFRTQGVTVKIISGDDPRTVSAIAHRAGLDTADQWVDASTLKDEQALLDAADRYAVFGRTTPDQKRLLVNALKAAGHSVAMTGDGVNDIPALKAADCSIAMAGGSDAAKHAAQLTLLDADFGAMPLVVDEGRRVINNIQRAASLFLVKTLYSLALATLLLMLPGRYPFQPIQLTFISSLTIGTPAFFLALEPNHDRIQGNFLRTVLLNAVPTAAAVTVCACVCMMLEHAGFSASLCSTLATLSAGTMGLLLLLRECLPLNPMRAALLGAMVAGFVLGSVFLRNVFFLDALTWPQLGLLAGLTLLGAGIGAAVAWMMRKREQKRKRKN